MSYDGECESLAWYFLNGTRATESDIAALAQTIQDVIQDWLTNFEDDQQEGTP
jgi:hypothetical protein